MKLYRSFDMSGVNARGVAAAVALLTGVLALPARATDWTPEAFYVEAGVADRATVAATVGLVWPWAWRRSWAGSELSASTVAFVSHWRADAVGGRQGFWHLGSVPLVRMRFDQGRSPWFVEGGIGISLTSRRYVTPYKVFSTRFNFVDTVAVGYVIGRGQELSLRLVHLSNADIKKPNPGEEFLQFRYTTAF